jgi:alkylhydroperoxidase family enzyme
VPEPQAARNRRDAGPIGDAFGYKAELRIDRGPDTLSAWWETDLHSESEQAALRYTEALTRVADSDRDAAFQRFHDALAEHFSPEEVLEIIAVVVNMNVWTRIKLAEGAMPGSR